MGYRKAPNPEGKTTVSHYSTLPRHSEASVSRRIDDVQPTSETLTGRAGLSLFVRYVRSLGLDPDLDRLFGSLRKSRKGQPVTEIFKQLWCFFLDGSSRHLVSFDALKEDPGYGAAIETKPEALLSSHAVKRFFGRFSMWRIWLFRRLLQQLFLWRLRLQQPPLILLGMDTMVMDNDEAPQRHGVAPTYKRVKGFQPLQVTWGRLLIDAVFRGGDKHSNHADTAPKTPESSDSEDSPKVPLRGTHHRAPGQRLFRSEAAEGLGRTPGRLHRRRQALRRCATVRLAAGGNGLGSLSQRRSGVALCGTGKPAG